MSDGTILIVDDDEDIRQLARLLLEVEGYRVATAIDGLDAWERLEAGERPAVILLDLMMPRMDGEHFLRLLRGSARAGTPVVVMSGHSAATAIARQHDADACLTKPIELEDLLELVRRFVPGENGCSPSP